MTLQRISCLLVSRWTDLLPVVPSSARVSFPGSLDLRRTHDEAQTVCRRADPRDPKELEAGAIGKDVCRRHGISEQTLYRWKAKFGGMSVSDAKRLKQLEGENTKLKKLVAELTLDKEALRELLSKNF